MQLETPIGPLTVTATKKAVTAIRFGTEVPEGSARCTAAEATPLLRKAAEAGIDFSGAAQADYLPEEIALVKSLTEYPSVVAAAGENFAPSIIGAYVYELAKQFNGYYHDHSILKEENDETRRMRLQLAQQVARVIRSGMKLLGIDVPARM